MFFKSRKKKLLDRRVIKKSNIPVLINDEVWRKTFLEEGNRRIKALGKELGELVEQEKQLKETIQQKKREKKVWVDKILMLSDLVNTKGQEESLAELELAKNQFGEINDALNLLYAKGESLTPEIERINLALLEETVRVAYGEMLEGTKRLDKTNQSITRHRNTLNELRLEKEQLEEKLDYLYSYLHTMIGPEEIGKLDIHYFKMPMEDETELVKSNGKPEETKEK